MNIKTIKTLLKLVNKHIKLEKGNNPEGSHLYDVRRELEGMELLAMQDPQERMDYFCGEAFKYYVQQNLNLPCPVMSDEEREETAKGFEAMADEAEQYTREGKIHMIAPEFSRRLARMVRSNFTVL